MCITASARFTERATALKNSSDLKRRMRIVVLIMTLLFAAAIAVGGVMLFAIPSLTTQQTAQEKVRELGMKLAEEGMKNYDYGAARTLAVDTEGNVTGFYVSVDPSEFHPETWPDSWYLKIAGENYEKVNQGEDFSYTKVTFDSQGEIFVYTVSGAPVYKDGAIAGSIYMFKRNSTITVTIIVFMIMVFIVWIAALVIYVNRSYARLRRSELELVKQKYVANVAHSLKTPVAVTKALAEALCDGVIEDSEKQKEYCRQILEESAREEKLIKDIMKLSELQSAVREYPKGEFLAEELFEDILERYDGLCSYKGIRLQVTEDFYRLPMLKTNAGCIKDVTEIILDNALKFTSEGLIYVSSKKNKDHVEVSIQDSGPGITEEEKQLVFEKFYFGKKDINKNGSGLGLAIAKETLQAIGEKIWVESPESGGAMFTFTIRLT